MFLKSYGLSMGFTLLCLALAAYWGHHTGMGIAPALWLTTVLGILEVSLSFDNAVVNASVLKTMSPFWQKMFITLGILIAVFGMRLIFPILIVSVMTDMGAGEVVDLALNDAERYGQVLTDAYPMIAAFGGTFLLMVFLGFALDEDREVHWLGVFEQKMGALGKLESIEVVIALFAVIATALSLPETLRFKVLLSGVSGIILFVLISSLDSLFEQGAEGGGSEAEAGAPATTTVARNGLMGFLYLEVLDASFSFDGVIGAFAITRDVVIIMLGLAIGAMFVRSLTIDLVRRGALDEYVYLEHGAMYAIGVLAVIMFVGTQIHVPEVVTGLIGAGFIGLAVLSSIRAKRREEAGAGA